MAEKGKVTQNATLAETSTGTGNLSLQNHFDPNPSLQRLSTTPFVGAVTVKGDLTHTGMNC